MISTPLEEKFRAFIYDHMGEVDSTYSDLNMITKVYTDQPRQDVSRSNFPRVRIKELLSPSTLLHRTSIREYDGNVSLIVFVDMDTPLTISGSTVSPEVACSQIGYLIIDSINTYWQADLFTGNEFYVKTLAYQKMGVDEEYFNKLNVYKGSVEVNGIYWR